MMRKTITATAKMAPIDIDARYNQLTKKMFTFYKCPTYENFTDVLLSKFAWDIYGNHIETWKTVALGMYGREWQEDCNLLNLNMDEYEEKLCGMVERIVRQLGGNPTTDVVCKLAIMFYVSGEGIYLTSLRTISENNGMNGRIFTPAKVREQAIDVYNSILAMVG